MLAAAVAALHAPGVEAAVSLLHDSDGGLGIRMAHAAQVREDAEMCARLLHELMIKQQRADAPPPGSEARQTLVTAVAQVQARERAAWALLEALMHG